MFWSTYRKYDDVLKIVNTYLNDPKYNKNASYDCVLRKMKELFVDMNKETIYKNILGAVTGSIKLVDFLVSGEHLGECWLLDCEKIDIPRKEYICPKCNYFTSDKLIQFEKDTILRENSLVDFLQSSETYGSTSSMKLFWVFGIVWSSKINFWKLMLKIVISIVRWRKKGWNYC